MSTAPKFKPWKRKEVERRNTIANLEGLPNFDNGNGNGEEEWRPVKPMKDRTVQFPAFSYAGKGSDLRPLTMPEPAFAPLRANRSSSLYSGSLFNSFPTEHFPPRARSAHLPRTHAGLGEGDVLNSFMTLYELLRQKKIQQSALTESALPRSDIYIARPYSVFDIADEDVKGRQRDSGISGLSKTNKSRRLSSSSSAASATSHPSTSRSDSASRFSQGSTYATSSVAQVQRALITVRDLDSDIRLSLDVDQEYGYRKNGFGVTQAADLEVKRVEINAESKVENDIVVVIRERVESGGGLEEWEEREMERRRREREKARLYKGKIRPGMGVQKGGGKGELGVQRGPWGGELGVQKRWTGVDD
ncbi:hypothetical protein IFR05_014618 [Cadophora sp. M221]|nr:hypothetical protein IFR05_014618 [Cadophora sp. M221]